jgi:pyrroline-5-carboxylate reductase
MPVYNSDQAVLDGTTCVIIALPGKVAERVIKSLTFRGDLQVVSLVAAIKLVELQAITNANAAIAVPLPAITTRQGATLGIPPSPVAEAIFSVLGSYTAVSDQEQFTRMQVAINRL